MQSNIAFASTNYGPMWAPVVASWLAVVNYTSRQMSVQMLGALGFVGITDRMYTMSAQNKIVQDFLKQEECTHLFLTESDMVLPTDCIVKLLAMDKDMASGVYFLRSNIPELRGQPCLYKKSFGRPVKFDNGKYLHAPVSVFNEHGPFRADVSGLGCVLIKRKVFETVKYPWFDLKAGIADGLGYGSDMYFYTHTREAGFELWVDPTVQCGQVDYYVTNIDDYHWQLENNPKFRDYGFIVGMNPNGENVPKT